MAFRDAADNIVLTEPERIVALAEFGSRGQKWHELPTSQQTHVTLAYIAQHRDAHPDTKEAPPPPAPAAPDMSAYVTHAGLQASLEKMTELFIEHFQKWIQDGDADVERQFATTLADVIAATDSLRRQKGSAQLVERLETIEKALQKLDTEQREKNASFDRRLSRNSDHIQKLDDRTRRE